MGGDWKRRGAGFILLLDMSVIGTLTLWLKEGGYYLIQNGCAYEFHTYMYRSGSVIISAYMYSTRKS